MTSRSIARALFGATALATFAMSAPAAAQRVERLVVFGDSYADDNNASSLILANPLTPAATRTQLLQTYPTGRFSGGTNYIDTLSQLLNAPVENFAIGGARTGSATQSNGLPNFTFEVNTFLAGGAASPFQTVKPTFGPNDMLAVSIGGNDARAYAGTLAGAPAAAAAAAASATTDLNRLVAAGARNISFLVGNTATLPETASLPSPATAAALRNSFSTAFNAGIQSTLAGYASNGVIVNYLDLSVVGAQITANPARYGLTSAGACPVAQAVQCVSNADFANQYLFYVDALHLTSAGFAIVGQYVFRQTQAPLNIQASSEIGLDTARQFARTLSSRVDLSSPRDGEVASGISLFALGDGFTHRVGRSDTNDSFKVQGGGGTVGAQFGSGNLTAGIAANYTRPRADFLNQSAKVRGHSLQVGGFAGYALGPLFAQAHVGYGKDRHKIERTGVVDNLSARADGSHVLAGAKAGYLMPIGSVRAGPVVALDYARAKVDGYTESGDAALALNVGSQRYKSLTGNVSLEMRGDFAGGGVAFRPFISASLEKDLEGDGRLATYALVSAPSIVNRFNIAERDKGVYTRLSAGGSAAIAGTVSVNAFLSSTLGKNQGNETSGHAGISIGF